MPNTIKCPYCDGEIQFGAKKCKHCKEWLIENHQSDSIQWYAIDPEKNIPEWLSWLHSVNPKNNSSNSIAVLGVLVIWAILIGGLLYEHSWSTWFGNSLLGNSSMGLSNSSIWNPNSINAIQNWEWDYSWNISGTEKNSWMIIFNSGWLSFRYPDKYQKNISVYKLDSSLFNHCISEAVTKITLDQTSSWGDAISYEVPKLKAYYEMIINRIKEWTYSLSDTMWWEDVDHISCWATKGPLKSEKIKTWNISGLLLDYDISQEVWHYFDLFSWYWLKSEALYVKDMDNIYSIIFTYFPEDLTGWTGNDWAYYKKVSDNDEEQLNFDNRSWEQLDNFFKLWTKLVGPYEFIEKQRLIFKDIIQTVEIK